MKGIVFLNGEPPKGEIDCTGALTVCCDGALRWAEGKARIDVKAGDFDSLGYIPADALVYPSRKNFTDGEIALDYLLTHGCTEIELYGGGGGRDDHFYGNLCLLYAAFLRGLRAHDHELYGHLLRRGRNGVEKQKGDHAVACTRGGERAYNRE